MNLHDIVAFVAVAETGSIGRAAAKLNLTQPAMTRRIQNFETAVGAVLLDRSSKPPVLTPAGRQVLGACRRVLDAVAEIKAFTTGTDEPSGELRVGVAHGFAEAVLSTPLDSLRRRFPGLKLQVGSDWTARLLEEVRQGGLDCAVGLTMAEHVIPPGVRVTVVGTERIVVVGRRGHGPEGACRLGDLADMGWVVNPAGCGCRTALQRAFDRCRSPMRVAAEVLGEDLQLSMIARSGGLGLAPRHQFEASPHRESLRAIQVEDFAIAADVAVMQGPSPGKLAPAIEMLIEAVAASVADILRMHDHDKDHAFVFRSRATHTEEDPSLSP